MPITYSHSRDDETVLALVDLLASSDSKFVPPLEPAMHLSCLLNFQSPSGIIVSAWDGDRAVGCVTGNISVGHLYAGLIYVSPNARRDQVGGVGRGLMQEVIGEAKSIDLPRVKAGLINYRNNPSKAFFTSMGFELKLEGNGYRPTLHLN